MSSSFIKRVTIRQTGRAKRHAEGEAPAKKATQCRRHPKQNQGGTRGIREESALEKGARMFNAKAKARVPI